MPYLIPLKFAFWGYHKWHFWCPNQRLQWTQIIWVCPDIWVFSVLDNRHLADICAFCQKCQFEVRKAWNALFLQLKPHEMHCKQADSAILKIRCGWNYANCEYVLFAYGLLSYSDFKQTRAFVAKRDMSQIRAFSDFFWLRFDSDNCDLTQTLLRHLSQKMVTTTVLNHPPEIKKVRNGPKVVLIRPWPPLSPKKISKSGH